MISRSQIRAEEYRAKARIAAALAKASVLERVREKHQNAASAWNVLAAFEEDQAASLRRSLRPGAGHDGASPSHTSGLGLR